jgi:hypothetical protein
MTVVVSAPDVHAFFLPEFGRKIETQIWPRPELTPERFVALAKARGAQINSCVSSLRRGEWVPVWVATWEEGGINMRLNGPACDTDEMRRLGAWS